MNCLFFVLFMVVAGGFPPPPPFVLNYLVTFMTAHATLASFTLYVPWYAGSSFI